MSTPGRYVAGTDFLVPILRANARANCTLILDLRDCNGLPFLDYLFRIRIQGGFSDPSNSYTLPTELDRSQLFQTDGFRITISGLMLGLSGTITLEGFGRFTIGSRGHRFYNSQITGYCDYTLRTRGSNRNQERFVHISAQQDFERGSRVGRNTVTNTTNPTQITYQGRWGTSSQNYVGGEVRVTPQNTIANANEISNTTGIRNGISSFIMQQQS